MSDTDSVALATLDFVGLSSSIIFLHLLEEIVGRSLYNFIQCWICRAYCQKQLCSLR
ncbi:hypothetical protein [Nostoc sp. 'Peltigera membranacea cyanobiont' N6]|uniref:hypothetical protein n=1 Tax=Nostoc sp. 'Peltigera membranacea cyanobiont' N6 TaxID=1261031 RepID=UPI0015E3E396|nr:hypothetical protein [Nostoc sp. 'Peltigera membranacea cyanobiont' N6]